MKNDCEFIFVLKSFLLSMHHSNLHIYGVHSFSVRMYGDPVLLATKRRFQDLCSSDCGDQCNQSSAAKLCLTLCNPMDYSTPGFPVPQPSPGVCPVHVHWVGDAIQPFHPLLPSSLALNLSQHIPMSRLFTSGGQNTGASASVLLMSIQGQFPLGFTGLISLLTRSSILLEKPGLCVLMDYFLILTRWLTPYKIYCEDQTKHIHKLHGDSLFTLFSRYHNIRAVWPPGSTTAMKTSLNFIPFSELASPIIQECSGSYGSWATVHALS